MEGQTDISESPESELDNRRVDRLVLSAALLLQAATVLVFMWIDPQAFYDVEALHNATVARELARGAIGQLLLFQYMPFCGGCTVEAVVGSGLFRLFGEHYLVWKMVPLGFGWGITLVGWSILRRHFGRSHAWAWAALLSLPPLILAMPMGMAWGNHYEVTLFVFFQLALAHRLVDRPGTAQLWFALGAVAGLGLWFCLSSAFALPAIVLTLLLAPGAAARGRSVLLCSAGLLLGLCPLFLYTTFTPSDATAYPLQLLGEGLADPLVVWHKALAASLWSFRWNLQAHLTDGNATSVLTLIGLFTCADGRLGGWGHGLGHLVLLPGMTFRAEAMVRAAARK